MDYTSVKLLKTGNFCLLTSINWVGKAGWRLSRNILKLNTNILISQWIHQSSVTRMAHMPLKIYIPLEVYNKTYNTDL